MCLQLHEVISRLLHLMLEVPLDGSNELLIGIVGPLVVVVLITVGCNSDPLESLLQAPLVTFGAPLCTFVSFFGRHPPTVIGDRLSSTLDKNVSNCLLTRGVLGGDVEQLLCGLWLITTKVMHQGPTAGVGPESRDDVGVTDFGELVAFSGEPLNVILEGLDQLLSATL
jgi:hypothetical protein